MTAELYILAAACLLGYFHIFAAGAAKTKQYGKDWNMGARDEDLPPEKPIVGRMMRADGNYRENFVIVAALLIAIVVAGKSGPLSLIGGLIWLVARLVYIPLYARGVPKVRTYCFMVSLIGVMLLFWQLLS